MELSEKIVYLRKSKGWSQEQMANKLEVSRQAVYKWEAGISQPEIDKLKKIAKIFEVSFNELLDDDISIEKPPEELAQESRSEIHHSPPKESCDEGALDDAEAEPVPDVEQEVQDAIVSRGEETGQAIKETEEEQEPSHVETEKAEMPPVNELKNEQEPIRNDPVAEQERSSRKGKLVLALVLSIGITVVLMSLLMFFLIRFILNEGNIPTTGPSTAVSLGNGNGSDTENSGTGSSDAGNNGTGSGNTGSSSNMPSSDTEQGGTDDEKQYYTVTFITGNGTPVDEIKVEAGALIENEPYTQNQGYTLSGWVDMSTYEEWIFANDRVTCDTVLYAVWMKENYVTVTYDKNDGSGITEQRRVDPRYAYQIEDVFASTSGTVKGWSLTPNGEIEYDVYESVYFDQSITLYAVWAEGNVVSVTYHMNDGSGEIYKEFFSKGWEKQLVTPNDTRHLLGWSLTPEGQPKYGVGATLTLYSNTELYAVWTDRDGFYFVDTGNNTCQLYAYTGTDAWLVVPSVYNGKSVTSIADFAFTIEGGYNDTLRVLELPSDVTFINEYTLYGLRGLTELIIPDNVQSISTRAFLSFASIERFSVSSYNQSYASVDGVLYNKAKTCLVRYPVGREDTVYHVPSGTNIIGECSFFGSYLEEVYFPNGVGVIRISAFEECIQLHTIDVANRLDYVEGRAFYNCYSLTQITFYYDLIAIGKEAFYNCYELVCVDIMGNVGEISYRAFGNCYKLSSVYIGGSATRVDGEAFEGCTEFNGIDFG